MKSRLITQQAVELILTDFEARELYAYLTYPHNIRTPFHPIISKFTEHLKLQVEELEETQ